MLDLQKDISLLPMVGPRYKRLLENLEIKTIEDLVYHFPFRYDDFSLVKNISDLKENDTATIKATIISIDNIFTRYGKKLTKAKVSDETGNLDLIWFNQHYLKKMFKVGDLYNFSGKVGKFGNKLSIISPEFEIVKEVQLNTGRYVPVYQETAGISSKWLRTRINDVLKVAKEFEEFLPKEILNKYKFNNLDWCIRNIHYPKDLQDSASAKKRFAFEELFLELLKVEYRKSLWEKELMGANIKINSHRAEIDKLLSSLPFPLSESQKTALEDIFKDLMGKHPMNRLLEGDVGSGKTVVALTASYLTHLCGYKTVYMAPTEILAQQHFETFSKYLNDLGLKIKLVTGNRKTSELNSADIIIGTHAILYKDENIENVGLVIVDEQHRFGVEQRSKLMKMGQQNFRPHLLTMTATPIPRTLALTIYGDLSISKLDPLPNRDKKVVTKVIPEKLRTDAYEWIRDKKMQTFIVCPLIELSETESLSNVKAAQVEYELLKDGVFNGLNVGLLHGRMKHTEKAQVIEKFKSGEINILVSTPVIEVGIDIPEATIIVIESAERYGLASLHQLRGRVGRAGQKGYCLVFMSNNSRSSYQRLINLEKITSGMELSEIDLKMRGEGDIYNIEQHGFKKFKVADIHNIQLLESVKIEAQNIFPNLGKHKELKDKLGYLSDKLVERN